MLNVNWLPDPDATVGCGPALRLHPPVVAGHPGTGAGLHPGTGAGLHPGTGAGLHPGTGAGLHPPVVAGHPGTGAGLSRRLVAESSHGPSQGDQSPREDEAQLQSQGDQSPREGEAQLQSQGDRPPREGVARLPLQSDRLIGHPGGRSPALLNMTCVTQAVWIPKFCGR